METRSYDWHPVEGVSAPLATMSGLEFFRGLAEGTVVEQPIASTIGWTIEAVEKGRLRLKFEPQPWLFQAAGLLHGGIMAVLLDSAMAGSIMSTLDKGQGCTTVQLSVTPVRGVRAGAGPLFIEGRVITVGKRIGVATGEIRDEGGSIYAQGSTNCLIL